MNEQITGPDRAVMCDLINAHTHTRRQERVGSIAANPDDLENIKEARGGHKVPRA